MSYSDVNDWLIKLSDNQLSYIHDMVWAEKMRRTTGKMDAIIEDIERCMIQ